MILNDVGTQILYKFYPVAAKAARRQGQSMSVLHLNIGISCDEFHSTYKWFDNNILGYNTSNYVRNAIFGDP